MAQSSVERSNERMGQVGPWKALRSGLIIYQPPERFLTVAAQTLQVFLVRLGRCKSLSMGANRVYFVLVYGALNDGIP